MFLVLRSRAAAFDVPGAARALSSVCVASAGQRRAALTSSICTAKMLAVFSAPVGSKNIADCSSSSGPKGVADREALNALLTREAVTAAFAPLKSPISKKKSAFKRKILWNHEEPLFAANSLDTMSRFPACWTSVQRTVLQNFEGGFFFCSPSWQHDGKLLTLWWTFSDL